MMEWEIHQNISFYADDNFKLMTFDEFINNHTNFEPEAYIKKFTVQGAVTIDNTATMLVGHPGTTEFYTGFGTRTALAQRWNNITNH